MQNDDEYEWTNNKRRESSEDVETPTEATKNAARLAPSVYGEDENSFNKAPLSHIFFEPIAKEKYKMSETDHDFCLLFRPTPRQFSICINRMRDEVVIPLDQIISCKFIDPRNIALKLKPGYTRAVGFPYKNEPLLRNSDPSNGLLSETNDIILRAYGGKAFEFLLNQSFVIREVIDKGRTSQSQGDGNAKAFQPNVNNSHSTPVNDQGSRFEIPIEDKDLTNVRVPPNLVTPPYPSQVSKNTTLQSSNLQSFSGSKTPRNFINSAKPSVSQSTKNVQLPPSNSVYQLNHVPKTNSFQNSHHEELYITCTFPTERRAILYSIEGSYFHLCFRIREKFKKSWDKAWYKSKEKSGDWLPLEDENDWKMAKLTRKKIKGYIRIEIYLR
ncbi:8082_t:CDS:2 [Acaulospora morrowiae]|uniref:8082_t:CDS:1 n=1 Tax=Acaulospora morrowiae TaxID=94023 RepID=A0A9N8WI08_9GLOM|nr:8082_t:CDS:2 [Acaulospora morrowiae]